MQAGGSLAASRVAVPPALGTTHISAAGLKYIPPSYGSPVGVTLALACGSRLKATNASSGENDG